MKVRTIKKRTFRKKGGPWTIGLRCKDYAAGCLVCDYYRFLDENGRFPYNSDEGIAFSNQKMKEEDKEEMKRESSKVPG